MGSTSLTRSLQVALDVVFDGNAPQDLMRFSGHSFPTCEEMYAEYHRMAELTTQERIRLLVRAVDGNQPQDLEEYTGETLATCTEVYRLAFSQGKDI